MTAASPCPPLERIAAAASGEDQVATLHTEACESCRDLLAKQRETVAILRRLPAPPLVGEQRRTIEALVRARADEPLAPSRRWPVPVGIVVIAAAATVAIVAALPDPAPERSSLTTTAAPTVPIPSPASARQPAEIDMSQADAVRSPDNAVRSPDSTVGSPDNAVRSPDSAVGSPDSPVRPTDHVVGSTDGSTDHAIRRAATDEVVTLRGGTLMIDARDRRAPVDVVAGSTTLHVADAKVRITARAGTVETVQVFAGSVEMTVGNRHTVIEDVWVAPATTSSSAPTSASAATTATTTTTAGQSGTGTPGPVATARATTTSKGTTTRKGEPREPPPKPLTPAERSLGEFRTAWTELHAEHFDEAIAHFDRATDPVVAEDATYWAAIACERAGRQDNAVVRLHAFLRAFPTSPRVDDARRVLSKLGH